MNIFKATNSKNNKKINKKNSKAKKFSRYVY